MVATLAGIGRHTICERPGGESMQSERWVLLLLDLIGGGAVAVTVTYVTVTYAMAFRQLLREMKRLDE
jgi:hypothetical protein